VKSGLFLPLFDALSDPTVLARIAAEAEEAGWDGVFVWDHIAYRDPVRAVADPWITMSAIACATSSVRIGPMVTPLPRRRPVVVARQVASLDWLSEGRLVLGVGTGGDGAGELSGTGEELDGRVRGAMLDESLSILRAAWTGERVDHRGDHYTVDGLTLLPKPLQPLGPPVWVAARYGNPRPLERAARHDGVFPIELENADQLIEVIDDVRARRKDKHTPYDVVVGLLPGVDHRPYVAAGATWCLASFSPYDLDVDAVRSVLREGPYSSG
jgi:alkanesulfonate monooxygenase SsuD/methylene tetrahydromethanopterin reductase-like flavin-dependent oxidoreductase (luciferase family)